MKVFDTTKLQSMDLFITTDYLPQSAIIKRAQGAKMFSDAGTHVFFYIMDTTGLCWNIGMGKPETIYFKLKTGLEIKTLNYSINNAPYSTKIVKVIRHPCWNNESARLEASKFLIYAAQSKQWNLYSKNKVWIKYDWAGFFSYLDSKHRFITQNKTKAICSEIPDAIALKFTGQSYTNIPIDSIRPPTPWDLQNTKWPEIKNYLLEAKDECHEIAVESN